MKALITGGAGMIGSHLARRMSEAGHQVVIFDDLSTGKLAYLNGLSIDFIQGDIRNHVALTRAVEGCDYVFHLAASGNVIDSIEDPSHNFEVNVQGTLNVLKACLTHKIKKLIFSSTGGALMGNETIYTDENSLPRPISPYGASKLACEGYIRAFAHSYNLSAIVFRFSNVYGPNSIHKKGVINKFIHNISTSDSVDVYGDVARDFIYVDDIVNGLILALSYENNNSFNLFHLSTGIKTKIIDLADTIAHLLNKEISVNQQPVRNGEVLETYSSAQLANDTLGFAINTSLTDGLQQTICWLGTLNNKAA